MKDLTPLTTADQRRALAAGVDAVERIDTMIQQLEYLRTVQLAGLSRLASRIARDEGHSDHGELVHRAIEAEVAAAIRIGRVTAANRMGHADQLLERYPRVSAAFAEGRISLRHTEVLIDAGQILQTAGARAAYEAEVLPHALESTPHGLRAHARRLAERFAERGIDDRHREARRLRWVSVVNADDGMADLTARIGAAEAYAIKDRLARIAHRLQTEPRPVSTDAGHSSQPEPRTLQQMQADAFVEILLSNGLSAESDTATAGDADPRDPISAIQGRVQVTVPVFSLMEKHPEAEADPYAFPAELEGYGPIDSSTARRLAAGAAGWDRVLTHPIHGTALAVDRYRPSAELRRTLEARDQHCRFPGCMRRLDHCDIDHTRAAATGGETSLGNLAHLCRRDHTLKHFEFLGGSGWKPRQRVGGIVEWTSPIGRSYSSRPSSSVRFAPVARRERAPAPSTDPRIE